MTGDHNGHLSDYTAVCIGNGQADQTGIHEVAGALNCMHDQQAIMAAVDCRSCTENNRVNGTLQAKENGISLNYNNVCRVNCAVRRLTPLECERLQGYPDNWTDIGDWTDSKGKLHKSEQNDSARYKALGNSIALPFWQWLAERICKQYDRQPTMASLFDGIGGFPLVFSRAGAIPVWASEIEPFPIAVTKRHFLEEGENNDRK
jgi:DNA (cytosine-5)-methyltransferase 1